MRHVIGVAGTAKNTGKTTTLQAVAGYLRAEGRPVFLTSIGYDGEDLDSVTGLPKPKISVDDGDRIATALPLMEASPVVFRDVRFTGVECALGPVYSGIASTPGRVILAGPTRAKDVGAILDIVPPDYTVLLDGAFSRMSPMSLATDLVFATGAARHNDPAKLAAEMESISAVMSLPLIGERGGGPPGSRLTAGGYRASMRVPGGLYADGSEKWLVEAIDSLIPPTSGETPEPGPLCPLRLQVIIDGPANPHLVESVVREIGSLPALLDFTIRHPVDMLLSGDLTAWPAVVDAARESGHRFLARKTSRLLGFTLNPYSPKLDPQTGRYSASTLPARPFLDAARARTKSPCTDIVLEGTGTLEGWLRAVV